MGESAFPKPEMPGQGSEGRGFEPRIIEGPKPPETGISRELKTRIVACYLAYGHDVPRISGVVGLFATDIVNFIESEEFRHRLKDAATKPESILPNRETLYAILYMESLNGKTSRDRQAAASKLLELIPERTPEGVAKYGAATG